MPSQDLDLDFLGELLDGDREFAKELFSLFAETSRQCLREAELACRQGDREGAVRAFHTLKGAAASVGLEAIREQSRSLESMAKESNFQGCRRRLTDLGATVETGKTLLATFLVDFGF